MPTNEERREVARKLRELAGTYITIGDLESALCIDMSSGRVDIARDAESISSLADLIEPEPTVDRDALLKLADEMEDRAESYMAQCPGAMKTWVATGDMRVVADKIRKACGEVE